MPKDFIYFPSFDTSAASIAGRKNLRLKSGLPWRFWSDEFPEYYRHKYFLVTGGHSYKKMEHAKEYGFPNDMVVMGDSGGFQVCSGAIEWEESLLEKMFLWLENNSNVAINLDIPPRRKYEGKFTECLDISKKNFKYFANHQTGRTDFLNVLHGSTYDKYNFWYDQVKGMPFKGWGVGGASGSVNAIIDVLCLLIKSGEIHNKENKWLHILGCSSVAEFLLLAKIQHKLNEIGSTIQVTTDSSSPSRSSSYGYWYIGYDLRTLSYRYIHLPRKDKFSLPDEKIYQGIWSNPISKDIWDTYSMLDMMNWKTEHYSWMVVHNFTIFLDCYRQCNQVVRMDPYIQKTIFNSEWFKIMNSIDQIFDHPDPIKIANIHRNLYTKADRLTRDSYDKPTNEFF